MPDLLDFPAVAHEWPCARISRTAAAYEVEVETPGFTSDELDVELEGHVLRVRGRPERGREDAAFAFTFDVPADADLDRVHAEFSEDVLTLKVPLVHRDGKRSVEIERPHLINPAASGG